MEKPSSIMKEDYEDFYFIDPETLKNARKKLETPMAPAMLCKLSKKCTHDETRGKTNEIKSKLVCILEASQYDTSRATSLLGTIGGTIAVTAQMRLHTSATAQSLSRTPEIALFE